MYSKQCLLIHKCENASLSILNSPHDSSMPSLGGVCVPVPMGFLKPRSKDFPPEDRRLGMSEPTRHFPGSGVGVLASDERM